MRVVYSREDVDADRPYKENYELEKSVYPKKYPALIKFERNDGGLGGDWWSLEVLEIPPGLDLESFIAGVTSKEPKRYDEGIFIRKK